MTGQAERDARLQALKPGDRVDARYFGDTTATWRLRILRVHADGVEGVADNADIETAVRFVKVSQLVLPDLPKAKPGIVYRKWHGYKFNIGSSRDTDAKDDGYMHGVGMVDGRIYQTLCRRTFDFTPDWQEVTEL